MMYSSLSKLNTQETMQGFYEEEPEDRGIVGAFLDALKFVVSVGAIPARLILRKNMGERAFSPFACFLAVLGLFWWPAFTFLLWIALLASLVSAPFLIIVNPFLYYLVYVGYLAFKHYKNAFQKARNNQTGYTRDPGESRYFKHHKGRIWRGFAVGDEIIRMIVEPKAMVIFGLRMIVLPLPLILALNKSLAILKITGDTGNSLKFAVGYICLWSVVTGFSIVFNGIFLFLDEFGGFLGRRNQVLDMNDNEFEMKYLLLKKETMSKPVEKDMETLKIVHNVETLNLASMPEDEIKTYAANPVSPSKGKIKKPQQQQQKITQDKPMTLNERYAKMRLNPT